MKRPPTISVVICSFNGARVLSGTLKAIKSQTWDGKFEVIVVDDGSTDDTYKVAKSFMGIKVIKNKQNMGLASSRNVGIKAAKGEIIAFTDDDCRPSPAWLKELYFGYTSDKILGVGGDIVSTDKRNLTLRYLHFSQPHRPTEITLLKSNSIIYRFGLYLKSLPRLSHSSANHRRRVYTLVGANMSFRKDSLEEVGMFDDRIRFNSEDDDLCMRINQLHPMCLFFVPKAKVIHQFEDTLSDTLRRSQEYGKGSARMTRKHENVRPSIYPFPLLILLSFLLGLVSPWLLLTPFIAVQIVYSRWVFLAIRERNPEALVYGYFQFLQEWYSNVGFLKGWWEYSNFNKSSDTVLDQKS